MPAINYKATLHTLKKFHSNYQEFKVYQAHEHYAPLWGSEQQSNGSYNTTSAQIFDAIPRGFTFVNTPLPVPDSCTSLIVGGSTAFLPENLANFSPHPELHLNPLNCLQSQSNFITLKWLYTTSIILLNLLPNLGILCLSVFRRLPNSHLICINFS